MSVVPVTAKSHARTSGMGCHMGSHWYPRSTYLGGHANLSVGRFFYTVSQLPNNHQQSGAELISRAPVVTEGHADGQGLVGHL